MAKIIGIPRNELLFGYEPDPDIGADILYQMEHHKELKRVAAKLQEHVLDLRAKFQRLHSKGRIGFFTQRELAFTAITLAQFEDFSRHATEAITFHLREATQTTQSVLERSNVHARAHPLSAECSIEMNPAGADTATEWDGESSLLIIGSLDQVDIEQSRLYIVGVDGHEYKLSNVIDNTGLPTISLETFIPAPTDTPIS
jgi:hypothetical protein